ncbi:hypothetical protein DT74_12905 [Acinetobacter sp. ETR1]|nr:hypothetical protein DT74_12905 [Acinetobacter sp. ETR1]
MFKDEYGLKNGFKFIWMIQNSDNLNIIGCFTDKVAAEKYIYDHQLKLIISEKIKRLNRSMI